MHELIRICIIKPNATKEAIMHYLILMTAASFGSLAMQWGVL